MASVAQRTFPAPGVIARRFQLPDAGDSREFRGRLLSKYKIVVKVAEKRWFNLYRNLDFERLLR